MRPQQPGWGEAYVLGKDPEQVLPGAAVLGIGTAERGDASWNPLATPQREAHRRGSDLGEGEGVLRPQLGSLPPGSPP